MTAPTLARATRVPAPVQLARALLAAVAISHVVVPVVLWANRGTLRDQIAAQHPEFGGDEVERSATIALAGGAAFHAILLAVCVLLAWKLVAPRPWVRRLTTISQLLSVVFSVFSWSSSAMFHPVIPIIGAAQILIVTLLWIPRPAREFFRRA